MLEFDESNRAKGKLEVRSQSGAFMTMASGLTAWGRGDKNGKNGIKWAKANSTISNGRKGEEHMFATVNYMGHHHFLTQGNMNVSIEMTLIGLYDKRGAQEWPLKNGWLTFNMGSFYLANEETKKILP